MIKLSAVIITYNEQKNIRRCLESVSDVVDEIVVVDSYSTDNTEAICKEFGVKFILHEFEGHIGQKNWATQQAKYDYIISLDADEILSDQLKNSIIEVKNNWQYDGYSFNRLTNYCGQWVYHTSWYPSRKLRLWDRRKGQWGGRNPHDRFLLNKGATHKLLTGDILHYSYNTIDEHINQINYFSSIIAKEYLKDNIRVTSVEIMFRALWRFFRDYFIKLGFLDGFYGFVISTNSSFETFSKYSKLKTLTKEKNRSENNKICFVNTVKSWGGGEKWHLEVSMRLHADGYKVILVSSRGSELIKRAIANKVPYRMLRIRNLSFLNPIKIFLIYKLLKREKVGTLIINLSTDLKSAGIAASLAGVKHIIYRRGSAIPIRNTLLNRYLYRNIVTKIIANSGETYRTILINNPTLVPKEKITVIYNGINLKTYDLQKEDLIYRRQENEIIIGNAGRLSEEKGQHYLIDLAKILKSHGYKFKILIVGKGKMENKLKKYSQSQGVADNVILLGFIENIRSFNITIDVFVLTSLYEGFGYVLVESMANRKPVVAFDIGSTAEIIENGKTGFLVEKGNVEQLAEKLELLINDQKLRETMGESGRKRVEEVFTFEKTIEKIINLINKD